MVVPNQNALGAKVPRIAWMYYDIILHYMSFLKNGRSKPPVLNMANSSAGFGQAGLYGRRHVADELEIEISSVFELGAKRIKRSGLGVGALGHG